MAYAYNQYGNIKERVRSYLDGRTDIDDDILNWVNDTRRSLAVKNPKGFAYLYTESTAPTVAGISRYSLPVDYLGHLNIFIGTKKLVRIMPGEFDAIHGADSAIDSGDLTTTPLYTVDGTETGEPDYYIDRGMEFDLWPIPNDTYTILMRYYSQPAAWTTDADFDYISTFHTEAVVFGAVVRGAIYLEDKEKQAEFQPRYEREISEMIRLEKDKRMADVTIRMKTYKDFPPGQFRRILKIG